MLKHSSISAADLISPDPHPFKWRMGVKPLNLEQWLLVDQERDTDLEEIGQLIDAHRDEIIYCEPSSYEGCDELSIEVLQHLQQIDHLKTLKIDQQEGQAPIETIRRVVQEDLCLLERRPEGWTMTACAVAIPTLSLIHI